MEDKTRLRQPTISDRLRLRAVEPEDAELMFTTENDSEFWYASDTAAPFSRHLLREYAENYTADPFGAGQLRLIAEDKETTEPVGIADFYELSALHRRSFTGIYIIESQRRKGYGSELLNLMARFARDVLGLRTLAARIPAGNLPSMALFESVGYRKCGILEAWHSYGGKLYDITLWQQNL